MTFPLKKIIGPVILISLLGIFIYSLNINNPLFWDDDDWIIGNTYVHDFSHVKEIFSENMLAGFGLNSNYYRPVLSLSFAFNYSVGGISPIGYHLVSNLFHIANALLLFLILYRLFNNKNVSAIAAIGWLIHPIHVESVAYISGRGDPMSLFFVLAVLCIIAWKERMSFGYYTLCLFLFLLGLLSRETALILPALIILIKAIISEKKRVVDKVREAFMVSTPFWVLGIAYFILRLTVLNFDDTLNFYEGDNLYSENLGYRILTFFAVFTKYISGIIWPTGLHMEPNVPIYTSLFQYPVWLGLLMILGIIVLGTWLIRNRKAFGYVWVFGWLWFFISISPASGIIPINAIMYYHWLYVPMVGVMGILGYGAYVLWAKIRNRSLANLFAALLIIYAAFWSILSIKHNLLWGNEIKFYEYTLKHTPSSLRIINNLANAYSEKGNLKKAEELYLRAIEISESDYAQPYYNLGNIYRDKGDSGRALELYKKAIEVDPTFHFAYRNIAGIYAQQNDLKTALEYMYRVRGLLPSDGLTLANIGVMQIELGDRVSGLSSLKESLRFIKPDTQEYAYIESMISSLESSER